MHSSSAAGLRDGAIPQFVGHLAYSDVFSGVNYRYGKGPLMEAVIAYSRDNDRLDTRRLLGTIEEGLQPPAT